MRALDLRYSKLYTPQDKKYKTTLKNEEKYIYNF